MLSVLGWLTRTIVVTMAATTVAAAAAISTTTTDEIGGRTMDLGAAARRTARLAACSRHG